MSGLDIDVTRDGGWWMVHIPELGGLTQARYPREADEWHASPSWSVLVRPPTRWLSTGVGARCDPGRLAGGRALARLANCIVDQRCPVGDGAAVASPG